MTSSAIGVPPVSYGTRASPASSGVPERPSWPHVFPLALIGLAGTVVVFGSTDDLPLPMLALAGFVLQLVTAFAIVRAAGTLLSISSGFAVLWLIYFPLRLMVITFGGPSPYYFPAVDAASPAQLAAVWEVTTLALLLWLVGQLLVSRGLRIPASTFTAPVSYGSFVAVGILGGTTMAALSLLQLSSGILGNVGELVLFAIGGLSYLEARGSRRSWASITLVLLAVALGFHSGFKELMLMPVAAWLIGRAGGGGRFRIRHVVLACVAAALAFGTVEGERAAVLNGQTAPNPVSALQRGLSSYSLADGVPAHYDGFGIAGNAVNGVLYRLKGVDYYIALIDRVPSLVPYQDGRSLWEPALSVLPGAKQYLALDAQYRQLSLGRFIDQTFVSENPTTDPSSQSTTPPGDLYLNFGIPGVLVGMLVLGVVYAMFDRRFPIRSAAGAGVAAFAGLPLLALDGNVAYMLVTSGLRLGMCYVLLAWLSRRADRSAPLTAARSTASGLPVPSR